MLERSLTPRKANLLLFVTAVLWGSGFVVLKLALDANLTAGFVNFFRGAVFMVLAWILFREKIKGMSRQELKVGLIAGILNFGGFLTQTLGVQYTTPSNNAFISSTYVIIVPFLTWTLYRKKLEWKSLAAIILCVAGMGILTGIGDKGLQINLGDMYSMVCALFYAGSIVYLGHGAKNTDTGLVAFMLAAVQTAGGLLFFLTVEGGSLDGADWQAAILPLLYVAVICSFLGQTIQIAAQKHTSATSAGLIMMLEGVFGSIFSVAIGFEPFTISLLTGGAFITLSLFVMEADLSRFTLMYRTAKGKPEGSNPS